MSPLLESLALQGLGASLFAGIAFVATRFLRAVSLRHQIWLVALLAFLVPPVWQLSLPELPGSEPLPLRTTTAVDPAPLLSGPASSPVAPSSPSLSDRLSTRSLLGGIWLCGSIFVLGLGFVRARRFSAWVARRGGADSESKLARRLAELSEQVGLSRAPRLFTIDEIDSPAVWLGPRGLLMLFPTRLLDTLSREQLDSLLMHELVHVRRGDPYVRYLELIVGALFWWNPVVWWIKRRLREAEELSCDEAVLRALPGHRQAYAEAFLSVLEFQQGLLPSAPSTASAAAGGGALRERLTMILAHDSRTTVSPRLKWTVALIALVALFAIPTLAERDADEPEKSRELSVLDQRELEAVREREMQMQDLEDTLAELDYQRRQIEVQRLELEGQFANRQREIELERIAEEMNRAEERGDRGTAQLLEHELEVMRKTFAIERQRMDLERVHRAREIELEVEMDRLRRELEHQQRDSSLEKLVREELRREFDSRELYRELASTRSSARSELERARALALYEQQMHERALDAQTIRSSIRETERRLAEAREQYKASHPMVQDLSRQIRDLKEKLDETKAGQVR